MSRNSLIQLSFRTGWFGYPRAFGYQATSADLRALEAPLTATILDPTAGGGAIPFESMRLGFNVFANDLNPVAATILSATVDLPRRFGMPLIDEFEAIGVIFKDRIRSRFRDAFPHEPEPNTRPDGYLWARTISCPYCSGKIPLSPNWRLNGNGLGVRVVPHMGDGPGHEGRYCSFEMVNALAEHSAGTVLNGDATCPFPDCARVIDGDEVKHQAQAGGMGDQLFCIVYKRRIETKLKSGKVGKPKWERGYRAPLPADDNVSEIEERLDQLIPDWEALDVLPNEDIPAGSKTDEALRYGMNTWRDMYSPRQLLGHGLASEIFREMVEEDRASGQLSDIRRAAYIYLSFSLDKLRDYNSRMTRWHATREVMVNTFDRHDFAFKWSYAEMVILIDGLGYDWAIEQTKKCIKELIELSTQTSALAGPLFANEKATNSSSGVIVTSKSGASLDHIPDESVDAVVMDPPYGANVMYAELSDFFYVWLKRTAGLVAPELFTRRLTDKQSEAVANKAHFKGQKGADALANRDYQEKMAAIFSECRRVLKANGIMTVMFTHKDTSAWDALTKGLIEAGFVISASWPVNTEAEGSLHIKDKAAANSTIFLVCRPRPAEQGEHTTYWEDVEPLVAKAVRTRVEEFQEAGIGGVDLYLASFGPALEEFSRHWPLKRGTPRPEPLERRRRKQAEFFEEAFDPYAVAPEDALDAARREVKTWRLNQLTHTKGRGDLDATTSWFVLAWDAFKAPVFKTGDRLAFNGSINETEYGWSRNWESFNVFSSWNDSLRVDEEETSFTKLWADKARRAITLDVPTALRDKLLTFLPDPDRLPKRLAEQTEPVSQPTARRAVSNSEEEGDALSVMSQNLSADEARRNIWVKIANAATQPIGGDRVGEATSAVAPWPHQIRAFHRLYDNWPPKLLIADEVGLGKTVQAGLLLRQAWLAGKLKRTLILAPKNVCKQWQIELREKFNLNWPIYDGQKLTWYRSPAREANFERVIPRESWHREPFVIMSSHLARRQDRQQEILEASSPWDLVILDEAHHARTKGAGTPQAKGPNRLLQLMRSLRRRTAGLLLLTATPLQVHATELWDLLDLLGLPDGWSPDAFVRFFVEVAKEPVTNERLDWLSALFRANEAKFSEISRSDAERQSRLSGLKTRKVLQALRDQVTIPRRQLSQEERRAAIAIIKRCTPINALVSRNTRELLRKYFRAGKISTAIAARQVEDRFIPLSAQEGELYQQVESYISDTYNRAAPDARNAVGFVMTIYRRRLASSFHALRQTMEKRKGGVGGLLTATDETGIDENVADLVEAGEEIDNETVTEDERRSLAFEEIAIIEQIVQSIKRLPVDTKALELLRVLGELKGSGYPQVMVFTQFSDTMDYLREQLISGGSRVMCFSGRGGEVRNTDGAWTSIARDEVKRRFKEGQSEVLVCTDAAAEGLNFQFCGALINYDMPWNPMRVEQRIGRIDRLGQNFSDIRIVNLHYEDTVEADVYRALRSRISIFEKVVGGLQPILAGLPRLIEESVLAEAGTSDAKRENAVNALETAISTGSTEGLNLDEFGDEDIDMPLRPDPALTLADLRDVLERPALLPPGIEARRLNAKDYSFTDGDLPHAVRITVDREFYELHSDSVELWTPGSPTFPDIETYRNAD